MLGAFRDNGETHVASSLTLPDRAHVRHNQRLEFSLPGEIVDPVEMLRRLVAFDTTSRNSNLALIDYVQDYLKGHGIESKLVPSEDGKKANT